MTEIISLEKENKNILLNFYHSLFTKNGGFLNAFIVTIILLIIAGPTVVYEIFFANAASIPLTQTSTPSSIYTDFGFQVDPPIYPSANQFTTLNPSWIRLVVKGKCTLYTPNLPKTVKILAVFNNQSCNNKAPLGLNTTDKAWENYINKYYIPDLQKFIINKSDVNAVELWNEEDFCRTNYCPKIPTQAYSLLVAKATYLIKNYDIKNHKNILVVIGGINTGNVKYLNQVLTNLQTGELLKQYPSTISNIDAVGLHPYGQSPDNGNLVKFLINYRKITGNIPIWITEIGTDAGNGNINGLNNQKSYIQKVFTIFQQNNIPVVVWYAYSDKMSGSSTYNTWGLYDINDNIKPVGEEFAAFTKATKGTDINFYIALQFINKNGKVDQIINSNPADPKQNLTIYLYKLNKNPSDDLNGTHADYKATFQNAISYNSSMGLFTTQDTSLKRIIIPQNIKGNFSLLVKIPGYLRKFIGTVNLQPNSPVNTFVLGSKSMPITLEAGDLNNDNTINLLDYNLMLSCFPNSPFKLQCPKEADLNDKSIPNDITAGNFWNNELNLLLQNFQQFNGSK